jgi:hypothetical protein
MNLNHLRLSRRAVKLVSVTSAAIITRNKRSIESLARRSTLVLVGLGIIAFQRSPLLIPCT